jgi:hypothetical protein
MAVALRDFASIRAISPTISPAQDVDPHVSNSYFDFSIQDDVHHVAWFSLHKYGCSSWELLNMEAMFKNCAQIHLLLQQVLIFIA